MGLNILIYLIYDATCVSVSLNMIGNDRINIKIGLTSIELIYCGSFYAALASLYQGNEGRATDRTFNGKT